MDSTIEQLSAGRMRSVLLTRAGQAWGCGAIKTARPDLPAQLLADLCISDASEVGHNRFAQPLLRPLHAGLAFKSLSDAPLHTLGVTLEGAVLNCRPIVGENAGASAAPVAGLPRDVQQLFAGDARSHALCSSGQVWSWGVRLQSLPGQGVGVQAPQPLPGLPPIQALAAGLGHAVALTREGQVWTWGANAAGQLGSGDLQMRAQPQPVAIDARIVAVGAGDTHSLAIDERGRLWAWGANNKGQLGPRRDGKAAQPYATRPVAIRIDAALAQVDGGMYYSVARTRDGEVYSWGWNGMGQLGRGDAPRDAGLAPARLPGLTQVRTLSAGQGHVLALADKAVMAWGDNRSAACGLAASQAVVAMPRRLDMAAQQEEERGLA